MKQPVKKDVCHHIPDGYADQLSNRQRRVLSDWLQYRIDHEYDADLISILNHVIKMMCQPNSIVSVRPIDDTYPASDHNDVIAGMRKNHV